MFVGAGSGCTVMATSSAAKPLPILLLLAGSTSVFASFSHDFEYFGIEHPGIVEMTDQDPKRISACIALICREGTGPAFDAFNGRIPVTFDHYKTLIEMCLLRQHRYLDAAKSLMTTAGRYGWTRDLIIFGEQRIAPRLDLDPSWFFKVNRALGESFRAELAEAAQHPAESPNQRPLRPKGS